MTRRKPEDVIGAARPFTGAEYLESLRDEREVYIYGERVKDVTTHPALAGGAVTIAGVFDRQHTFPDECLTPDPDTGEPINIGHLIPRSIDDLKGLKIRMMGNPIFVDTMTAMGGNGVAMGYDQLINALQTGVVDGAENNEPSYNSGQHYRYAKYYSMTQHLIIPEILVFSKRTWGTLSKEDQDLIMKEAKAAQKDQWDLWAEMEKKSVADMKAAGVEINTLDNTAMADAVKKSVYEKHAKALIPFIERIQAVK